MCGCRVGYHTGGPLTFFSRDACSLLWKWDKLPQSQCAHLGHMEEQTCPHAWGDFPNHGQIPEEVQGFASPWQQTERTEAETTAVLGASLCSWELRSSCMGCSQMFCHTCFILPKPLSCMGGVGEHILTAHQDCSVLARCPLVPCVAREHESQRSRAWLWPEAHSAKTYV